RDRLQAVASIADRTGSFPPCATARPDDTRLVLGCVSPLVPVTPPWRRDTSGSRLSRCDGVTTRQVHRVFCWATGNPSSFWITPTRRGGSQWAGAVRAH